MSVSVLQLTVVRCFVLQVLGRKYIGGDGTAYIGGSRLVQYNAARPLEWWLPKLAIARVGDALTLIAQLLKVRQAHLLIQKPCPRPLGPTSTVLFGHPVSPC